MKPRDYQRTAIKRIVDELRKHDRAKVVMPCGTGKTLVGMLAAQRINPRRSLIAAPSLALVKQLLDSYAAQRLLSRVLVVCSDDTTAKQAREKYDIPNVTTNPETIAAEMRKRGNVTVFSTYQSTPRIAEVFAAGRVPRFDLGLFDEAHRMAGSSGTFTTALFDDQIPIAKRLFMTATPRVATQSARRKAEDEGFTFVSMDDEEQFGREAYYMSFNEAIRDGHLTDYRLVVFFVKESEVHAMVKKDEDAKELAKRVALVKAMAEHDIRKVLAYHRTVRKMQHFARVSLPTTFETFKSSGAIDGDLWSTGLAGTDANSVRKDRLNEFATLNGNHRAVLSNCQVLQEGVDCPAVDGVCLFEPRTQPADIVQIIGRAIRKSPGKKIASIILPVFVPQGVEEDEFDQFLQSSDFAPVLDVIAALRSHDERVEGWASSPEKFRESVANGHVEFNMDLPVGVQRRFFDAITSRVVGSFAGGRFTGGPLTEELIWQWMQEYKAQHGKWPTTESKENTPDGSSWRSINDAFKGKYRGLSSNSASLSKFRKKMLAVPDEPLTEELIWQWMQDYHQRHGKWPTQSTAEKTPCGMTWNAIAGCMYFARGGIKRSLTIKKLREEKTGISHEEPSIADIRNWLLSYVNEHGRWPKKGHSEQTPNGSTWGAIDAMLRKKHNQTLASIRKQIDTNCEWADAARTVLNEDEISKWMQDVFRKTGRWPNVNDTTLTPFGCQCRSLDRSLVKGHRGLPGGSSLAKLRRKSQRGDT